VPGLLAAAVIILLFGLGGCTQETVLLQPTAGDDSTGQVRHFSLVVYVRAAPDDQVGLALGWATGVPGAQVVLESRDGRADSAQTDADGSFTYANLLAGDYRLSALRLLGADERAAAGEADAFALAGGTPFISLTRPDTVSVTAHTGTRGSLIISEYNLMIPYIEGIGDYPFGFYAEIYNNGDSTAYLDGMLLGEGWAQSIESELNPCSVGASFIGPEGLWAWFIYRFPGTGTTYRVEPGRTVVIATDAIDHRPVVTFGLDLSGAQFEFVGPGDPDNPAAANMIPVGPRDFTALGHGFFSYGIAVIPFLADPLDVDTLPTRYYPGSTTLVYRQLPRAAIRDVAAFRKRISTSAAPLCPRIVDPSIDEGELQIPDGGYDLADPPSPQRRVLATLPSGRLLLQRTGASVRDFRLGPRTPFVVK
jgi:hypothetical protein